VSLKTSRKCGYLLAVGLFSAVVTSAYAVQLNPDGLGEALIYPYYTVRQGEDGSAYNTLLSLTNNTGDAKAVKIHIREGQKGEIVASLNVFLAERDMWTAAFSLDGDGLRITTYDNSCTSPPFQSAQLPFSHIAPKSRVQEGYIEVIEMGTISSDTLTYDHMRPGYTFDGNGGVTPPVCGITDEMAAQDVKDANTGGLFGHATLINVQSGFSFNIKATALAQFAKSGAALGYTEASSDKPDMTSAHSVSVVRGNDGTLFVSEWKEGTADAVKAALTVSSFSNDFVLAETTTSKTAWITTFPLTYTLDSLDKFWYQFRYDLRNRESNGISCSGFLGAHYGGSSRYAAGVEEFRNTTSTLTTSKLFLSNNKIVSRCFAGPNGGPYDFPDKSDFSEIRFDSGYGQVEIYDRSNPNGELSNVDTMIVYSDGTVVKNAKVKYHGAPAIGFSAITYTNAGIALSDGKIARSIYGVTTPHNYARKIEVDQ